MFALCIPSDNTEGVILRVAGFQHVEICRMQGIEEEVENLEGVHSR